MAVQLQERPEKMGSSFECRVYERLPCDVPTSIRPASSHSSREVAWPAMIQDLSTAGLRMILKRRFEPGTGLALELPSDDGPYTVLAKVIHVRAHPDGGWALGCQFISELSESELERLMNFNPPPADETLIVENVRFRLGIPQGNLFAFRVRQLKVAKAWPPAAGEVMELQNKSGNRQGWNLTVAVTNCAHVKGVWTLECRLVNPPGVNKVLRALGSL